VFDHGVGESVPYLLVLSDENAGTEFPSPSKGSVSSYTAPLEFDELSFFVLLELVNLLISSNGSEKWPEDESVGAEADSNILKGSSVALEVVLDALKVDSDDEPISGVGL
jgi:hypothetical protein